MEKEKAETVKTSVKSYKRGINVEKQKMTAYSEKFKTNVRSLQANFKSFTKDLNDAAEKLREEGIRHMRGKVSAFKGDIKSQIKENKEAISHMENNVKYFVSKINGKRKDFQSYAHGPFKDYIKPFWGVE